MVTQQPLRDFNTPAEELSSAERKQVAEEIRETTSQRRTTASRQLSDALDYWTKTGLPNVVPVLPALLRLRGKPYTLDRYFPFEPCFNTFLPRNLVMKTARQVSKSTTLASQGVLQTAGIEHFNTLFVTPRFEQIRRFSVNYVKPFIDESPWRKIWVTPSTSSSVLQRGFRNLSNMFFSFALLDADRTRGLPCDKIAYDEVQDLEASFIDIIREATSGSQDWKLQQFAGTPKTMDNALQKQWELSSMGEWVIPCTHCRRLNIPSLDHDLLAMLGPLRDDISPTNPGTICANPKCRRVIYPWLGRWWHRYPDRLARFAGYHVPQLIMPMHYGKVSSWYDLLAKQVMMPEHIFLNEVCGESFDHGAKILTETDLRRASTLHQNTIEVAVKARFSTPYVRVILSMDWGGGGTTEEASWTVYAVLGLLSDGRIDVIYGYRSSTPMKHKREAAIAMEIASRFKVDRIVHDFNVAGSLRETLLIDAGWPENLIWPVVACRTISRDYVNYVEELGDRRAHWQFDKARGLQTIAYAIQRQRIRFFKYDGDDKTKQGLIPDFLALVEDRKSSRFGSDTYTIIRMKGSSDDFAQAVTMGSLMLWEEHGGVPDLASTDRFQLPPEMYQHQNTVDQYAEFDGPE